LPTNYWPNFNALSFSIANVRPKSVGYLELQSSDPYIQPIIQPNYLTNSDDIKVVIDGLKWVFRIIQTNTFSPYGLQVFENTSLVVGCESLFSIVNDTKYPNMLIPSDNYLECVAKLQAFPGLHLSGTCKMGSHWDRLAVVNPRLKVLGGINGLRVADASIMPRVTNTNTNGPSIMIGERAAQFIKDDYKLNKLIN
jgi:choline dehydrogenase